MALVYAAEMRPLFKMVAPYLMFNRSQNVLEVQSRNEYSSTSILQITTFGEVSDPESEEGEVAAEVCGRSVAVDVTM